MINVRPFEGFTYFHWQHTVPMNLTNFEIFFHFCKTHLRVCILSRSTFSGSKWSKKLLPPFMVQYLNLMLLNGFTKILKTQEVQSCKKPPTNSGKTSTIFDIFYFVSQNICQFRWDANFENIFTCSNPVTIVTQILVKIWLILWYEFFDWSCVFSQVSYVDVK